MIAFVVLVVLMVALATVRARAVARAHRDVQEGRRAASTLPPHAFHGSLSGR